MVSLSHLAGRFLLIAGIGGPSATCYKQSWSSVTVYSARLTKRGWSRAIHSHGRPGILCTTARLDITPKTTEQNRIVRTGKSEAEVTNNKKKHWRYCTVEVIYRQTRSIVWPLCDSRVEI